MIIERDVSVPSWIMDRVQVRTADILVNGTVAFGDATLRIGRDLHPRIRLQNTVLTDDTGLVITRIPMVEGLISPRGLILQQDVLVQDIRLIGAQINLRRAANGAVAVAFTTGGNVLGQAPSVPELLDQLDQIFERPALDALEIVRADGLIINFDDARAGRSWVVDNGTLSLDLRQQNTVLRGEFALLSGRAEVTEVRLSYEGPRNSRSADLSLNINNAIASDIAAQSPALTWMRDLEAPISASLRTSFDDSGDLGLLHAALEIGPGALQPNPATVPVPFDLVKAYLTYDPVRDSIAFREVDVQSAWGAFGATGVAYLREFQGGLPRALLAQLSLDDVTITRPDLFEAPPLVPHAIGDFRIRFDPFSVQIGQIVLNDGPMRAVAAGAVSAAPDGWHVALDAKLSETTPEQVIAVWPQNIRRGTKAWVTNNILAGRLFNGQAGLRVRPGKPPVFAAGFEFSDATVRFLRDMPIITGAAGVARFEGAGFIVAVDDGVISAPQGGQLDLGGSVFAIPDLRIKPAAPAYVELTTDSSITAVLSILNQPPFMFMDRARLPVTLADGRAFVNGRVDWPLKPRATFDEISFEVASDMRNVRSTLVTDRILVAPELSVVADPAGLQLTGLVNLDGAVADAVWQRPFGGPNGDTSQIQADVTLSPEFLTALDVSLPPGTVSGAANGLLTIDLQQDQPPAFTLRSDLRGMQVAVPAVGWSKTPQEPASLLIEGRLGELPEIRNLEIEGGGLSAIGRITLAAGGGFESAIFQRVRIENWFDAEVRLQARGPGEPVGVEVLDGRLDLRQASFGGSDSGQSSGPIDLRLDALQITDGVALTDFRGSFRGAGGFTGQFEANVNGAARIRGTVAPRNGRSAVRLQSDDAGGVLSASGLMRNVREGALDLTLLPTTDAGQFDGTLSVRGVRVQDAPTMAALLDAISVVGLLQQLDGQGLAFDEVDARFRLTPERVVVSQASAVGPGLGISVDGTYTLANKDLDLQGVVSPFYLVNSIGSFLTRKGEGLIGFNFNIGGNADAPQVIVNPLSALTPGMFREIFRRPAPELDP